jgi:phage shock protein PspC (stress-responsive transcriptional regulator)
LLYLLSCIVVFVLNHLSIEINAFAASHLSLTGALISLYTIASLIMLSNARELHKIVLTFCTAMSHSSTERRRRSIVLRMGYGLIFGNNSVMLRFSVSVTLVRFIFFVADGSKMQSRMIINFFLVCAMPPTKISIFKAESS